MVYKIDFYDFFCQWAWMLIRGAAPLSLSLPRGQRAEELK
jgi:hypothetical protein